MELFLADDHFEIYFYPGTQVLRNIPGITNARELEKVERQKSLSQLRSLPDTEISVDGYNAIHRHLFGSIYEWAGKNRTVGMTKGQSSFLPPRFIEGAMYQQFDEIKRDNNLKGLSIPDFADRAAYHIGAINHVHSFREGNGRTMRAFLGTLSRQAGLRFEEQLMPKGDWVAGTIQVADNPKDTSLLQATIEAAIPGRLPSLAQALRQVRNPERQAQMQALFDQLREPERQASRDDELEK